MLIQYRGSKWHLHNCFDLVYFNNVNVTITNGADDYVITYSFMMMTVTMIMTSFLNS